MHYSRRARMFLSDEILYVVTNPMQNTRAGLALSVELNDLLEVEFIFLTCPVIWNASVTCVESDPVEANCGMIFPLLASSSTYDIQPNAQWVRSITVLVGKLAVPAAGASDACRGSITCFVGWAPPEWGWARSGRGR
jgi:hypothetical protein